MEVLISTKSAGVIVVDEVKATEKPEAVRGPVAGHSPVPSRKGVWSGWLLPGNSLGGGTI